jgi:hypothetical protein
MDPQDKWKAAAAKVAFAKEFPGLLRAWEEAKGKTVHSIVPLEGRLGWVVLFEDKTFLVTGGADPDPADLLNGIAAAGDLLQRWHPDAFTRLESLKARDVALTSEARQEKILSAIRHNAPNLPGLKEAVAKLLKEL